MFLKKQRASETSLTRLTILIQRHPEYFWNTLFLPDGHYFPDQATVVVYTNWIEEDVHWAAFRDRHDSLPHRLNVILFSLARIFLKRYRQPALLSHLRRKQQKELLTDLNKVLLHELGHFLDFEKPDEVKKRRDLEQSAETFEVEHQSLRLINLMF